MFLDRDYWVYFAATNTAPGTWTRLVGWSFFTMDNGVITLNPNDDGFGGSLREEIDAEEFWSAATKAMQGIAGYLQRTADHSWRDPAGG